MKMIFALITFVGAYAAAAAADVDVVANCLSPDNRYQVVVSYDSTHPALDATIYQGIREVASYHKLYAFADTVEPSIFIVHVQQEPSEGYFALTRIDDIFSLKADLASGEKVQYDNLTCETFKF